MTKTSEQLWKDASSVLGGMLNPDMFARWFGPVKPIELKEDVLVLGVANEFSQIWLQDNFLPLVREAVNQNSKEPLHVKFVVVAGKNDGAATSRQPEVTASVRPALDVMRLNPRYTFDTFVIGPNNN